jgi:hypothetical protein
MLMALTIMAKGSERSVYLLPRFLKKFRSQKGK